MIRLALIPICLAAPVAAQDFQLPVGCDAYLTIQSATCSVTHYFTCDGDASGDQRRADIDEDGLVYVGRINSEAEWVESFHLRGGFTETLAMSVDPMSLGELLSTGSDTFEFETTSSQVGVSRYVGMDRLTGETAVIDGIELLVTEYSLTAYDNAGFEIWRSSGNEYINPEWRIFMSGTSTFITSDDTFDSDDRPVDFIFPGEAGFLSVNPKHGCGLQMSSLRIDP